MEMYLEYFQEFVLYLIALPSSNISIYYYYILYYILYTMKYMYKLYVSIYVI